MQTITDEFSAFSNPIQNVYPKEKISIHTLYTWITDGRFIDITEKVREGIMKKGDDLPYITPSGVFTKRSNNCLVSYSGIICIDLDQHDINFKYVIINDPFLNPVLIFVSPSGNGLKIFIRIQGAEASKHLDYWMAIKQHFLEKYQIDVDKSCKDVARACFLCHDPETLYSSFGSVNGEALLSKYPPLPISPSHTLTLTIPPSAQSPNLLNPGSDNFQIFKFSNSAQSPNLLNPDSDNFQISKFSNSAQSPNLLNPGSDNFQIFKFSNSAQSPNLLNPGSDNFQISKFSNSAQSPNLLNPGSDGSDYEINLLNTSQPVFSYAQNLLVRNGWRQNNEKFLRPGSKGSGNDLSAVFAVPPGYTIPVFYNFSDNGHPFQPNKGYSPVQVICTLEYNDNFKDCITALKTQFSYLFPTQKNPKKNQHESAHSAQSPNLLNPGSDNFQIFKFSNSAQSPNLLNPGPFFRPKFYKDLLYAGKEKQDRKQIVGPFLYQDTTSLFFSRTNYGKSIMAFQFAYHAATGTDFEPGSFLSNQCEPMMVVVVDLELDEKAHYDRHKKLLEDPHPLLNKNLLYLHEKLENNMVLGFDLLKRIEEAAIENKAKLLVIDNISKLLPDALRPEIASMTISMLNSVRIITGASILIIGHTTKGNPNVCVQPTDYYGSAMIQNFFNELFYLDKTKDGKFFLAQSKTKFADCYDTTVPIFTRGEHHRFGLGFTYCHLANVADVRLPYTLESPRSARSRNLNEFKKEINTLLGNGYSQSDIAKFCDVSRSAISKILNTT